MNERDRILHVMQSEGLNAKQFCQEVGISPGTLSNITGGRNKPSLDVMQAILRRFRAVSCDWLIMGVGNMYVNGGRENVLPKLFDLDGDIEVTTPTKAEKGLVAPSSSSGYAFPISSQGKSIKEDALHTSPVRSVQKIVVFYSDGTFEER